MASRGATQEAKRAFQSISRLIIPGNPEQSRFLLKPLHPDGGGSYTHNGPRRWQIRDDPEWRMLAVGARREEGQQLLHKCRRASDAFQPSGVRPVALAVQGSDVAWSARIGTARAVSSTAPPCSAAVGDSQNVDASGLRSDIDRANDGQRKEIEGLDGARFGCHSFDGDEGVAIVR